MNLNILPIMLPIVAPLCPNQAKAATVDCNFLIYIYIYIYIYIFLHREIESQFSSKTYI